MGDTVIDGPDVDVVAAALPDRARTAMLTMDLRRKESLLRAAESRSATFDVDSAVAQLRTRLGRSLADRQKIHAAESEEARSEAAAVVAAAKADAESILARSARRARPAVDREDPTWWPSATPVPSSDDVLARRERARHVLARTVDQTENGSIEVDTADHEPVVPRSEIISRSLVSIDAEPATTPEPATQEVVTPETEETVPVLSFGSDSSVDTDFRPDDFSANSLLAGPDLPGKTRSESTVSTQETGAGATVESGVEFTELCDSTVAPAPFGVGEWSDDAATPLASMPHALILEALVADESEDDVNDPSGPVDADAEEDMDPWRQYEPPQPAVGPFDSEAFAAALATALAPLLAANRSGPQQIVLRPAGTQKKPAFKTTAGHVDVALAFVGLAIALAIFLAWMT